MKRRKKKITEKEMVDNLMAASRETPQDDQELLERLADKVMTLEGVCHILLLELGNLHAHLLESTPFDINRMKEMTLSQATLDEVRETHFPEMEDIISEIEGENGENS
jgi:hypothetical protein